LSSKKYKAYFISCLSYALALNFGHIKPFFAFISDTGDQPYESCIFGEFCDVISLSCNYEKSRK
jgi:hypothetical protein